MRNLRWSLTGLFVCSVPMGCADPCLDDGLSQDNPVNCPAIITATDSNSASATQTASESESESASMTATMGTATMGSMSGSQTMTLDDTGTESESDTDSDTDTDTDTDSSTESDTDGETLWCLDEDGDGFGDPDNCVPSDTPIPGSTDNGDDCDDSDENTFPGAAPNDDPDACMRDEDGDNWGDDNPPKGVEPGTDCIDTDHQVSPGAAEEEPDLCTSDLDNDGWGTTDPPRGAEAGTDCLDDNPNVFPGAAENEMPPDLCAEDADGDGWGNDNPPAGAEPGNDCDDMSANTFPGAAELETPADLCMADDDGDGWGDSNPEGGGGGGGGGPVSGSDCYDSNPDLSPDTLTLTALMPFQGGPMQQRNIMTVDPATATLGPFVDLFDPMGGNPNVDLVTATLNANGEIYTNDLNTVQLQTIDYAATCVAGTGELAPVGMPYGVAGDIVCGLEFGGDGNLYGINTDDQLVTFDPATGQITNAVALTFMGIPLNIDSCGMAYDCTADRLLVANGINQVIYSVDIMTGVTDEVRNLDAFFGAGAEWLPTGLEYDPVNETAYISTGNALFSANVTNTDPPVFLGVFPDEVSNLQYLPMCM